MPGQSTSGIPSQPAVTPTPDASADERRKRFQNMTPEQREEFRKRREAGEKGKQ